MSSGYCRVRKPDHPNARKDGRIKRSRLIMSEHLGRPLRKNEHVHHINGQITDDRIENLAVMTPFDHMSFHKRGDKNHNYKDPKTKICTNCSKKIVREKGKHFIRNKFCSKACSNQYYVKEQHPNAKITQEIADNIKSLKGKLPSRKIALEFNISPSQVKRILRGDAWS